MDARNQREADRVRAGAPLVAFDQTLGALVLGAAQLVLEPRIEIPVALVAIAHAGGEGEQRGQNGERPVDPVFVRARSLCGLVDFRRDPVGSRKAGALCQRDAFYVVPARVVIEIVELVVELLDQLGPLLDRQTVAEPACDGKDGIPFPGPA